MVAIVSKPPGSKVTGPVSWTTIPCPDIDQVDGAHFGEHPPARLPDQVVVAAVEVPRTGR